MEANITPRDRARQLAVGMVGGNPIRISIIAAVIDHPWSSMHELARVLDIPRNTIKPHLAWLVDAGLVQTEPDSALPFQQRRGHVTRYAILPAALVDAYADLGRELRIDQL